MHPLLSFYLRTAAIVIGGAIALVGIPIFAFGFLAGGFGSAMCGTYVSDEVPSPNKKLKAVVFQIDCGATTGFNTHVAIGAGNLDTKNTDNIPYSFFLADLNSGRAPSGKDGGPEVRLQWRSDSQLVLQHHNLARVVRASSESEGVAIEYQSFR